MSQLSFIPSVHLLDALAQLDALFKQTHLRVTDYPERVQLALHRYAKKGMLGFSANYSDVLSDVQKNQIKPLLVQDKRHNQQHNESDINGYLRVLDQIYQPDALFLPLTEEIIQRFHFDLMQESKHARAGKYKNKIVRMHIRHKTRGVTAYIHTAPVGAKTQYALQELLIWYNSARTAVPWTTAVGCEFIMRFLRIHPFLDGNTRLSRNLFLLILKQSPYAYIAKMVPYLGINRFLECERDRYVNIIASGPPHYCADPDEYQIEALCLFMISVLQEVLIDITAFKQKLDNAICKLAL